MTLIEKRFERTLKLKNIIRHKFWEAKEKAIKEIFLQIVLGKLIKCCTFVKPFRK